VSLRHEVPDGPVRKLVLKIVATDTPTSSSVFREGWARGRRWHGPGGECFTGQSKADPRRWCVQWENVEGAHSAEFVATVTWERVA
jgi:hypothetical protein